MGRPCIHRRSVSSRTCSRSLIHFLLVLHRIHECALDLVEYDYAKCEDEGCETGGVAEGDPAEFAYAEHSELEGFHDAGERVCLHEHFQARVFDGAEWVNYRSGVHP